jgi:predicted amidohydrolase YtcJ
VTTTIFTARHIVTMNPSNPEGTAVAVREGRVLAVGTLEECLSWGAATVDDRFADRVLVPGFVEAHGHTADALVALMPYVGYYDFPHPDGGVAKGVRSYDELIAALRAVDAELPPGEPLIANSFDPIFFAGQPRLSKDHLDAVSTSRPVFVRHASGHLATVNSVLLREEGITRDVTTPGVSRGPDGEPDGELQEAPAMNLARNVSRRLMAMNGDPQVVRLHGALCRNAGVTTSTELVGPFLLMPEARAAWESVVNDSEFPARMVLYNLPSMPGTSADWDAVAKAAIALRERDTDRLINQGIKLVIDGSIQGWTAVVRWPGYYTGTDHGLLLSTPEDLAAAVTAFTKARLNVHCHCNGNGAVDAFLDAVDAALGECAWLDHRHVVQHSQTTTQDQYRRMARLGVGANIFTNHIYYWGDQHRDLTMGPERVRGMWACRTALREGVTLSFHSDSGVTPIGHLMTMWCAVNRVSSSGAVLGEYERITAYEALWAATIGAAEQLHLDDVIGSIECGKWADFAVLDESPLEVDPMSIKDIRVHGTIVGGVVYLAPSAS